MTEILAQVIGEIGGRPFAAGIVLWNDKVIEAAPILRRHFKGKSRAWVREHCRHMNWTAQVVHVITR